MESEFNKIIYRNNIEGISVHATRIFFEELSVENLLNMKKELRRACRELKTAEVDVIVYGCTSGSFVMGKDFDKEIIKEIEMETGITATTVSTALIEALNLLKVRKIAIGTPYSDTINERARKFFEDNGFEVIRIIGLNVTRDVDIGKLEPYVAYKLGVKVNDKNADCILLLCTDFRTIEILDILEKRLKKPVISSNQAALWHVLHLKDLGIKIKGYGSLLETWRGENNEERNR